MSPVGEATRSRPTQSISLTRRLDREFLSHDGIDVGDELVILGARR